MTLKIILPFGEKTTLKDLVFTILTNEYPLKIIELTNIIRKRYGRSVTFQAVRKALLELLEADVLTKTNGKYKINRKWVSKAKQHIDNLYLKLNRQKTRPTNLDSIKGELTVFTFSTLNDMMKFWQDIIDDWYENFKKGDPNINCYKAAHAWEALLHLDREKVMMERLKKKKIKSYILTTGNTPLDKQITRFYKNIGIIVGRHSSSKSFDKDYYIATYGKTIVQAKYPKNIVKALETFFKKNKDLSKMNLEQLSTIANKKIDIQLTIIKNKEMAKHINKSIIDEI